MALDWRTQYTRLHQYMTYISREYLVLRFAFALRITNSLFCLWTNIGNTPHPSPWCTADKLNSLFCFLEIVAAAPAEHSGSGVSRYALVHSHVHPMGWKLCLSVFFCFFYLLFITPPHFAGWVLLCEEPTIMAENSSHVTVFWHGVSVCSDTVCHCVLTQPKPRCSCRC